jgi:hypothetical protein
LSVSLAKSQKIAYVFAMEKVKTSALDFSIAAAKARWEAALAAATVPAALAASPAFRAAKAARGA